MKCAILQPSFIPWRGYFHQIQRADVFVFLDSVQYDKHGWRNRNQIKTPQGPQWLTIPVSSSGTYAGLPISDVRIAENPRWRDKHVATITQNYRRAPFWSAFQGLVDDIYNMPYELLVDLTCNSTKLIARALGIQDTVFVRSSELNASGERTDRLIDILKKVGAKHYISGPSARSYLETDKLRAEGITFEYMHYEYPEYPQLYGAFEPKVSVLDLLFNVGNDARSFIWMHDEAGEATTNWASSES